MREKDIRTFPEDVGRLVEWADTFSEDIYWRELLCYISVAMSQPKEQYTQEDTNLEGLQEQGGLKWMFKMC